MKVTFVPAASLYVEYSINHAGLTNEEADEYGLTTRMWTLVFTIGI
jgi:hypothetical protein